MGDIFRYHAKNGKGEYVDGELEANTEEQALNQLTAQGLFVIGIQEADASRVRPAQPAAPAPAADSPREKSPARAPVMAEHLGPSLQRKPPPPPDPVKARQKKIALIVILVLFSLLFFAVTRIECHRTPKSGQVDFRVLTNQAVNPGDPAIQIINISVPAGTAEGGIKLAAQKAWDQKQAENKALQQALFQFFFPEQDPKRHSPVATLRFNWENSGQWEYSFSLDKARSLGRGIKVKQKQYKLDQFVIFEFITPESLSAQGAQKEAETQLKALRADWRDRVKRIDAELIYENFYNPFMTCSLRTEDGKITCRMAGQ